MFNEKYVFRILKTPFMKTAKKTTSLIRFNTSFLIVFFHIKKFMPIVFESDYHKYSKLLDEKTDDLAIS